MKTSMGIPAPPDIVPLHQWTQATGPHAGKVLIVRCGRQNSYGFKWPSAVGAKVSPRSAPNRTATCGPGKLYGWAWGQGRDGKDPDYSAEWLVFAADPADVIDLDGKIGVAGEVEVIYCGTWDGAQAVVLAGQIAWAQQHEAHARALVEYRTSQAKPVAGSHTTAKSGAASATGDSGAASATGYSGAASATGERSIGCLTGEYGRLEAGPYSLGAVTAQEWIWIVHSGAVVACRWQAGEEWRHALLVADDLGLQDGAKVHVSAGQVQS